MSRLFKLTTAQQALIEPMLCAGFTYSEIASRFGITLRTLDCYINPLSRRWHNMQVTERRCVNREAYNRRAREWQRANRVACNKSVYKWRRTHPEAVAVISKRWQRKVRPALMKLLGGKCSKCGVEEWQRLGVGRGAAVV